MVGVNSCEGTRPRNARGAIVEKLIARSGIQSNGADGRPPPAVRRARMLSLARRVPLVLDFKGLHRTAHVQLSHSLDRIPYPDVTELHLRLIRRNSFSGQRNETDDVKLVADK